MKNLVNPVISYGIELTRLDVNIYDGLPSKEKAALAEEIYQIIDEEAKNKMCLIFQLFLERADFINLIKK